MLTKVLLILNSYIVSNLSDHRLKVTVSGLHIKEINEVFINKCGTTVTESIQSTVVFYVPAPPEFPAAFEDCCPAAGPPPCAWLPGAP